MHRIFMFLLMLIVLSIAVHVVWLAIAPFVPFALGGLVLVVVLAALYYRRRPW